MSKPNADEVLAGVAIAGWFGLMLFIITAMVNGCGPSTFPGERALSVRIQCDKPDRCHVTVYGATEVEAYYGTNLAWYDTDIGNSRNVYVDSPPEAAVFTVVACNDDECIEVER